MSERIYDAARPRPVDPNVCSNRECRRTHDTPEIILHIPETYLVKETYLCRVCHWVWCQAMDINLKYAKQSLAEAKEIVQAYTEVLDKFELLE